MAIFRLDKKSDEKLYIIWYITHMSLVQVGDEISFTKIWRAYRITQIHDSSVTFICMSF